MMAKPQLDREVDPQLDPRFLESLRLLFVTRDVRCPKCRYNLNGLTTDRCPECGHNLAAYLREYDLYPERFGWRRRLATRIVTSALQVTIGVGIGLALILALEQW